MGSVSCYSVATAGRWISLKAFARLVESLRLSLLIKEHHQLNAAVVGMLPVDAASHIFIVKAHSCRGGFFRLCEADRHLYGKCDQDPVSDLRDSTRYIRQRTAPLHSITSSARASRVGEMFRPSSFAAFRLTAIWSLVGNSTGKSFGLAPFRIL